MIGIDGIGWPHEPWASDPALLDGAMQLALLWTEHLLGGRSLPTAVGRVRMFGQPRDGVHIATLVGRRATTNMVECDISIRSSDGSIAMILEGVRTHRLHRSPDAPDLEPA